jgi:hypothetical protein
MTFNTVTDLITHWLPWFTIAGVLWRGYFKAKGSVTEWADKLLDNHMDHFQGSLDRIEGQQSQQIELLQKIADK